jgi:hypothetical protein
LILRARASCNFGYNNSVKNCSADDFHQNNIWSLLRKQNLLQYLL